MYLEAVWVAGDVGGEAFEENFSFLGFSSLHVMNTVTRKLEELIVTFVALKMLKWQVLFGRGRI